MKRLNRGAGFLVGALLLTGNTVVADDVELANGQHASADLVRRVTRQSSPPASATEAAPASSGSTDAFPPLPTGGAELKFNEFLRPPIGPRGLEFTDTLRGLEGRRIHIQGCLVRQDEPAAHCSGWACSV